MAADTTILGGDVSVWFLANNRAKMMDWSGAAGDTRTMNELYSAMATLLDESGTIDDGSAFNADTPVEYTTGKIDSGDNDPWYVTMNLMEHITGGSLRTSGWAHVTDTNTGIVIVPGANVDMDSTDIGDDVSGGSDGNGTLLEIIEGSQGDFLVIRPDSAASANEFTGNAQTITSSPGAQTFTQHATEDQNTGELVWTNLYSIGTIDPEVHMYVYQGAWNADTAASPADDQSAHVYSVNSSVADYWVNGHIDMCVPLTRWYRLASEGALDIADNGYLRVFGRKGGDLFASFEVSNSITSGGRNPVPMQTSLDLNSGHGTKKISTAADWSSTFTDLEIIGQATTLARAVLDLGNSTDDSELVYWPIAKAARGGEVTAFADTYVITGETSGHTATANGAEANDGPALATWFTSNTAPDFRVGDTEVQLVANLDIDNDGTNEDYAGVVDCSANPLSEVYQWMKFVCQFGRGDTDIIEQAFSDDLSQDDVWGEEYEGGMGYFVYGTLNGSIAEGDSVSQAATSASGVIMSINTTSKVVMLRNIRGTFDTTNILDDVTGGSNYFSGVTTVGQFAASVASPLGTFAGGTYFGARGIVIEDYLAADENRFILTDIQGTTRERPTSITIEVTNLWGNAITNGDADLVGIYPLTGSGGNIDKDPTDAVYAMNCDGGEAKGDATLAVDAIPVWAPSAGRLVLIDDDAANKEYLLRYSGYDAGTDVYTLANVSAFTTTGTNTATQVEYSGGSFLSTVKRGDLVYNVTEDLSGYVKSVDSDTVLTLEGTGIVGNSTGDSVEINCVPITVTSSDNAYNCVMHEYPLTDTESIGLIYPGSAFYFRVKVRNTREDDLTNGPIKPYSSDGSTSGTNQSIPTVRTIDTVIS